MITFSSEICNSFTKSAKLYERNAIAQKEIGNRLLERLDYTKIKPKYILDLGAGTGIYSKKLQDKYPDASVISMDFSFAMLQECRSKDLNLLIQAQMEKLPFREQQFDLIFSNQVVHWSQDMRLLFKHLYTIAKDNALFTFSTLGPDTFIELRKAWSLVDNFTHTNSWVDMHHIGDQLVESRWSDPVIDTEKLILKYNTCEKLIAAIKSQGVRNISKNRRHGLTGKKLWQSFLKNLSQDLSLTYEIIYAQAWKSSVVNNNQDFYVTVEDLKASWRKNV